MIQDGATIKLCCARQIPSGSAGLAAGDQGVGVSTTTSGAPILCAGWCPACSVLLGVPTAPGRCPGEAHPGSKEWVSPSIAQQVTRLAAGGQLVNPPALDDEAPGSQRPQDEGLEGAASKPQHLSRGAGGLGAASRLKMGGPTRAGPACFLAGCSRKPMPLVHRRRPGRRRSDSP
jgi:hypothetical protein